VDIRGYIVRKSAGSLVSEHLVGKVDLRRRPGCVRVPGEDLVGEVQLRLLRGRDSERANPGAGELKANVLQ
jgi:hypothetical protein